MRSWRVVGLVVTACVVALALLLPGAPAQEPATDPVAPPPTPVTPTTELAEASAVLAAWDERRAEAWAAGDAEALARLYAPGARSAVTDLRLMRHWLAAGWRVEGLRTQVLAVSVVRSTPGRLSLRVVDRVAGGRVVPSGATGGAVPARSLPATRAVARTIELRRSGTGWQVVASTPVGRSP